MTLEGRWAEVEREAWRYGFPWGPMTVVRLAHLPGRGYSLEIRTAHQSMQVYVSEKGQKIKPMPVRELAAGSNLGSKCRSVEQR